MTIKTRSHRSETQLSRSTKRKKTTSRLTAAQKADCAVLKAIFDAVNKALVESGKEPISKKTLAQLCGNSPSANLWSMHMRGKRALTTHAMSKAAAIYGFSPEEFSGWPWNLKLTASGPNRILIAQAHRLCKSIRRNVLRRAEAHRGAA